MPEANIEDLTRRALYAAAGVVLFGLLTGIAEPQARPALMDGYDSTLLAMEMAGPAKNAAVILDGQQIRLRWAMAFDFGLIASYTALFWLSAQLESRRVGGKETRQQRRLKRRYRAAAVAARGAILVAALADIGENLGLLISGWTGYLLPWATLVKWGALGVVLIAVSLLFLTWPLWSEFHVALAAVAFFYCAAGVIGIYGSIADAHKLERVALPFSLGVLTQAGILIWRREFLAAHLRDRLVCRLGRCEIAPRTVKGDRVSTG